MRIRKAVVYPSKTTLNLAMKEKSQWRPMRVIPMFAALILAALLFGKFAVADRLAEVALQQQRLSALEVQAAGLRRDTADYEPVLEEYRQYSTGWMTDEERAVVDRVDLLDLIQAELMTAGAVRQFSASGNVLSVELVGVTLEDTSRIVNRLYLWPIVTGVSVFNASNQQEPGVEAAVSMVVSLARSEDGEGGDG